MSDPVLNKEPNGDQGALRAGVNIGELCKRLSREGRWKQVEPVRDAMMSEARAKGMSKHEAQAWTYSELDRMYPPITQGVTAEKADEQTAEGVNSTAAGGDEAQVNNARTREGLGGIPENWPDLPSNASLAAEIAWVQAERLRIVEERPGGPVVRLERARSPAPSWSALSWLETSIRSYAKYVEVAAKATATAADEQGMVRRERMAIEEIRELLGEMVK